MRMAKISVYLPDDLEEIMREEGLSPSELLQDAVRHHLDEVHRQELIDEWLAEAAALTGPPTEADQVWAEEVLAPLRKREARGRRAS
jgi:Arc/MetJ-type ribon-helix-helix transcriptional regulator